MYLICLIVYALWIGRHTVVVLVCEQLFWVLWLLTCLVDCFAGVLCFSVVNLICVLVLYLLVGLALLGFMLLFGIL